MTGRGQANVVLHRNLFFLLWCQLRYRDLITSLPLSFPTISLPPPRSCVFILIACSNIRSKSLSNLHLLFYTFSIPGHHLRLLKSCNGGFAYPFTLKATRSGGDELLIPSWLKCVEIACTKNLLPCLERINLAFQTISSSPSPPLPQIGSLCSPATSVH